MPPKKRGAPHGRRTGASAAQVHVVDPNAWVDLLSLNGPNATVDTNALWKLYRLDAGHCGATEAAHIDGPCDLPRCLLGARIVKDHHLSLKGFADRLMGPLPEPLDEGGEPAAADGEGVSKSLALVHRGLRNLGNTCYLNCILQLVFHVPELRRAIVIAAQQHPNGDVAASGLAWIFLQMGFARFRVVDPTPVVASLHLDRHVQQDAQELLGLLLQWIATASPGAATLEAATASPSLAAVLERELEGVQLYVRRCPNCGAEVKKVERFSFLSVIPTGGQLSSSLNYICQDEDVEGFQCGKCSMTVTATSRMHLKKLPKTLLIHLARFGYDPRTARRTKIDDSVSFPTVLDMGPWLSGSPSTDNEAQSVKYSLEGVVNHLGSTPQSGHYTYHCRQHDDAWYAFDDADVTRLRKYGGENAHSRDAYVLVYRATTTNAESELKFPTIDEFPGDLVEQLLSLHHSLREKSLTWHERRESTLASVKEWSSLMERVVRPPKELEDDGPLYFVSRSWFTSLGKMFTDVGGASLATEATSPAASRGGKGAVVHDAINVDDEEGSIHCVPSDLFRLPQSALCSHGKLRIGAPVKAITEGSYCLLSERYAASSSSSNTPPITTANGLCERCALDVIRSMQAQRNDKALDGMMKQLARVSDVTVGCLVNASVLEGWLNGKGAARTPAMACGEGGCPSTDESVASPVVETEDDDQACCEARNLTKALVCPHGNLDVVAPTRAISMDVFRYLIAEQQYVCSREFPVDTEPCQTCCDTARTATSARHDENQRKLNQGQAFETLLTADKDINRHIFKRDIDKYTKKHRTAWKAEQNRLEKLAREEKEEAEAAMGKIKIVVAIKKAKEDNEEAAEAPPPPPPEPPTCPPRVYEYHCIPMAWVDLWRDWYHDSTHTAPAPPSLSTEGCLCPHGGVASSVRELHPTECVALHGAGSRPNLMILSVKEYEAVVEAYGPVRGPKLVFSEVDDLRVLNPLPCEVCTAARLEDSRRRAITFSNGVISVEGAVRRTKKRCQDVSEAFGNVQCTDTLSNFAQRLVMRILERHQLLVPTEWIAFTKSKSTTSNPAASLPMDKSFLDNGIAQLTTLHFFVDQIATKVEGHFDGGSCGSTAAADGCGAAACSSSSGGGGGAGAAEVAFGTSRLSGFLGNTPTTAAAPQHKECPVCTYHNVLVAKACEMCESPL